MKYKNEIPKGCVFGLAPNGLGTMALGAKVKTGEKLSEELCVLCVSSVAGGELGLCRSVDSVGSVRDCFCKN